MDAGERWCGSCHCAWTCQFDPDGNTVVEEHRLGALCPWCGLGDVELLSEARRALTDEELRERADDAAYDRWRDEEHDHVVGEA